MRTFTALTSLLLVLCICSTSAQTCEGNCGNKSAVCWCHPTCTALGSCCSDYKSFCVDTSPYSGTSFGGTDFTVLDASFTNTSHIVCRFNGAVDTLGYVDGAGRAHCVSPLLYETGWVPLLVSSDNGTTFNREGAWFSVHTGKLDAGFKATLVNATRWQYYGTTGARGPLEMTWNASMVRATRVNVELWGYRETGEPYSDSWRGEWRYLYSLAKNQSNNGSFSFLPEPAQGGFSSWELGALRISAAHNHDGAWNVQAVWTEDHALAWHLEESFRQDSELWARDKCLSWDRLEDKLPNFLSEIIDCPCTLAQARADTGRFHTDYGCDIEKGSVCTYHPGSVHCVRAIQASPVYAAGQQCCYDSSGAQVLTADSIGGSTPDRAHDWGSPPYGNPPRIPGTSHWVYDVLSFYYCCLWSDNCSFYFKHRPSSDCRRYRPPRSAVVFGDPHFITFDGVRYSFNGKGEYTLLMSPEKNLTIQGRTEAVNGSIRATQLTAVAMREASSDVIEVRLGAARSSLQVLQNQKVLSFSEQSWMDLHGVFVFAPSPTNVTVMFPSGAGAEVRLMEGTMTTTVLLPEEGSGAPSLGLLGSPNGDASDDLLLSTGEPVRNISNPEELFSFGASWALYNASALFTYDSQYLLDNYFSVPRHDHTFIPVFSVPESPDDPLNGQASEICSGEGEQFCRFDVLVGRSPRMGNATRVSFQSHSALVKDLTPVRTCGRLAPPENGQKDGTTYLQGATLTLSCDSGYALLGSRQRTCQEDGLWSGQETSCKYFVGILVGSVIGALALIVVITSVVLSCKKEKKKQRASEAF